MLIGELGDRFIFIDDLGDGLVSIVDLIYFSALSESLFWLNKLLFEMIVDCCMEILLLSFIGKKYSKYS